MPLTPRTKCSACIQLSNLSHLCLLCCQQVNYSSPFFRCLSPHWPIPSLYGPCQCRLHCWLCREQCASSNTYGVRKEPHRDRVMHWRFMQPLPRSHLCLSVQESWPTSRLHQCSNNDKIPHQLQYWLQGSSQDFCIDAQTATHDWCFCFVPSARVKCLITAASVAWGQRTIQRNQQKCND